MNPSNSVIYPDLLHFRRSVSDLYAAVRKSNLPSTETWQQWRQSRDQIFGQHPQTALSAEQLARFRGLSYYAYNPNWRFEAPIDTAVEQEIMPIETAGEDGTIRIKRFGRVHLQLAETQISLSLYWLLGYGGGLFLPFRDATNGNITYGGGRYLFDTIKHADLGQTNDGKLILDFNYAYNPSCAYNHQWSCPLAPPENWLTVAVPVGEKLLPD